MIDRKLANHGSLRTPDYIVIRPAPPATALSCAKAECTFLLFRDGTLAGTHANCADAAEMSRAVRLQHLTLAHVRSSLVRRGWVVSYVSPKEDVERR